MGKLKASVKVEAEGAGPAMGGRGPGAYAFVLSLTEWENRQFSGGETILLRDDTLSHWSRFFDIMRDDPRHPAQVASPHC